MRKIKVINLDIIVLFIVILALFFTCITVSPAVVVGEREAIAVLKNDTNIKIKEFQRSISSLNDDVCDDCDDDDNDGSGKNNRPSAYIFEVKPNPSQEYERVYFTGYGTDADGDDIVAYRWESNIDGLLDNSSSFNLSNLTPEIHNITFFVQDDRSLWSEPTNISLRVIENQPPLNPVVGGKGTGKAQEENEYHFITSDPNDNEILYFVEWGDGTTSEWIGSFPSNHELTLKHTWEKRGNYEIKAKAKDIFNAESDWGTMKISMAHNKGINNVLLRFFENYPNLFPILRTLLEK